MPPLPTAIVAILRPFAALFTAPTWVHAQLLLVGTLLAQGPRTVTAALRARGLGQERRFERYHRILNRARWSGLRGAQILLGLLIRLVSLTQPLVVAVDETLERRQGEQIAATGMYRDAVRSSCSKVVTCLGLQWICMALLVPLPWRPRPWALPLLTLLAPSARAKQAARKPHRTVVDCLVPQTARDLFRWPGIGAPHPLGRVEFRQLNIRPGLPRHFPARLGTRAGSTGFNGLKWPKSSLSECRFGGWPAGCRRSGTDAPDQSRIPLNQPRYPPPAARAPASPPRR